jgi:hypothetical protein
MSPEPKAKHKVEVQSKVEPNKKPNEKMPEEPKPSTEKNT